MADFLISFLSTVSLFTGWKYIQQFKNIVNLTLNWSISIDIKYIYGFKVKELLRNGDKTINVFC